MLQNINIKDYTDQVAYYVAQTFCYFLRNIFIYKLFVQNIFVGSH